ncbi:hypothetical protein [Mycoplasma zalophidermidis]|uniref:Lipoprotein n=1 Tax=Mycoplasma zalophidermidis TaxID=398174 RepID=A0ABS6DTC9_9MOLU|nr:hypothetical protein [Mycoplasma zalophidermidis]MBU4689729.1 hypothetical protein [Mycoplasma zalophidermidis]MBU4693875.1 hypothetical protein [Mycoplasma zalophidermidis]MCR8966639.1 hypothetical protein [Mycoplasma zalophidermidis]
MKKILKFLTPISIFCPVALSASCLDGTFNEHADDWNFSDFETTISNPKNIKTETIKVTFKQNYSSKAIENIIIPAIKGIKTKQDTEKFIKNKLRISLVATRPHSGWDVAGGAYDHIHEEIINDVFKDHTKVLRFEMQLIESDNSFIKLQNNKLTFKAKFASKNFDSKKPNEPLYYFTHTFELDLEKNNG